MLSPLFTSLRSLPALLTTSETIESRMNRRPFLSAERTGEAILKFSGRHLNLPGKLSIMK